MNTVRNVPFRDNSDNISNSVFDFKKLGAFAREQGLYLNTLIFSCYLFPFAWIPLFFLVIWNDDKLGWANAKQKERQTHTFSQKKKKKKGGEREKEKKQWKTSTHTYCIVPLHELCPCEKLGWFGQFVALQIVGISDLEISMFQESKLREFPDLSTELVVWE